jgi:hypothetical protein
MRVSGRDARSTHERKGHTMSMAEDERSRKRREHDEGDEPDVEGHSWSTDDPLDDDPERKRKRKEFEDSQDDEFGRKRK